MTPYASSERRIRRSWTDRRPPGPLPLPGPCLAARLVPAAAGSPSPPIAAASRVGATRRRRPTRSTKPSGSNWTKPWRLPGARRRCGHPSPSCSTRWARSTRLARSARRPRRPSVSSSAWIRLKRRGPAPIGTPADSRASGFTTTLLLPAYPDALLGRVDYCFFMSRAESRASCFTSRFFCRHSARVFSSPALHSALTSRAS